MDYLVFQLQAPMAAWGEPAVGEYRGSADMPGESALIGLLGAALGLRREDEAGIAALRDGYRFAVGLQASGHLLRDYHTAQVPGRVAMKGRPHASRRDELRMPKEELGTILSTRDYRQDGACLVAVQAEAGAPHALAELAAALRRPRFVLYLGRKSCPPGAPLHPQVVSADSVLAACQAYRQTLLENLEGQRDKRGQTLLPPPAVITKLFWGDGMVAGVAATLTVTRKDRLIRRKGWRFGDRMEHAALLPSGEPSCIST